MCEPGGGWCNLGRLPVVAYIREVKASFVQTLFYLQVVYPYQRTPSEQFNTMAPSIEVATPTPVPNVEAKLDSQKAAASSGYIREPLKYSGSLDEYKSFDVTPVIGKEFPELQLTDILNDDQKLRDLAITGMLPGFLDGEFANAVFSVSSRCRLLPQSEHQL
jgi:hypothetical protein